MSSTKKPTAVKYRKEIVRMSSLKKTSTFKKYKRIVKNVITIETDSSHKYKRNSEKYRKTENVIPKEANKSQKVQKKQ